MPALPRHLEQPRCIIIHAQPRGERPERTAGCTVSTGDCPTPAASYANRLTARCWSTACLSEGPRTTLPTSLAVTAQLTQCSGN